MEHLPLPDGVQPFIVAPYEAPTEAWYDHQGFLDFPQRRGWTEEQLRGGDDLSKDDYLDKNGFKFKGSSYEVEQFFQTWLFFGLAIDVLKMGGVTVTTEDFLKQQGPTKARIIDTSKLPALLVEWEKGIKGRRDHLKIWTKLNQMFEKAASVLDRFCVRDDDVRPLNLDKPRPWPVRDEISTTMIAIAFSLRRAAINICDCDKDINSLEPWPRARSEILARRLQQKWCQADVTTAFKQLPIDGHYYMAGSTGLDAGELDHHSKCIKAHCLFDYNINLYITRHTGPPFHRSGCQNEINYGGQLGPERGQRDWVDAICRIIDKDAIPIAIWVKGLRKLWSIEYHFTGQRTPAYVAISHVWTDGKGNPNANSLPECQLDKIQRLVEKVTWKGRKEIPSNPNLSDGVGFWMDTLCVPVKDKERKMKAILNMRHVYSHAKAVLVLDDWIQQIRSDAPLLEIITRLYQSNWLKRLWTHQEGFLPPVTWIQFCDRSVELDDLADRFREYNTSLQATGVHLEFPLAANMRFIDLYAGLRRLMQMTEKNKKYVLYLPLSDAMSVRKTSRLADETICLATIVDIDVQQFLNIPDKPDEESTKRRMALFLQQLKIFDSGLVFNNYERLDERGYKWAPKSLLNFRTGMIKYGRNGNQSTFQKVNGQLGLLVQYHGFLIDFANGKPSFAAVERGCAIKCEGAADTGRDINGTWFIIELPPNKVEWTRWKKYAVILSEIPIRRGQRCPAFVAWYKSGPVNGIYTVEHESVATARLQDTAPPWVDTVGAPLLNKTTKWLVA